AFQLEEHSWRSYRRELSMRDALLQSHIIFPSPGGELTRLDTRRSASRADPHLLIQEIVICAENHSGVVQVEVGSRPDNWSILHPHLIELDYLLTDGIELQHYRCQ